MESNEDRSGTPAEHLGAEGRDGAPSTAEREQPERVAASATAQTDTQEDYESSTERSSSSFENSEPEDDDTATGIVEFSRYRAGMSRRPTERSLSSFKNSEGPEGYDTATEIDEASGYHPRFIPGALVGVSTRSRAVYDYNGRPLPNLPPRWTERRINNNSPQVASVAQMGSFNPLYESVRPTALNMLQDAALAQMVVDSLPVAPVANMGPSNPMLGPIDPATVRYVDSPPVAPVAQIRTFTPSIEAVAVRNSDSSPVAPVAQRREFDLWHPLVKTPGFILGYLKPFVEPIQPATARSIDLTEDTPDAEDAADALTSPLVSAMKPQEKRNATDLEKEKTLESEEALTQPTQTSAKAKGVVADNNENTQRDEISTPAFSAVNMSPTNGQNQKRASPKHDDEMGEDGVASTKRVRKSIASTPASTSTASNLRSSSKAANSTTAKMTSKASTRDLETTVKSRSSTVAPETAAASEASTPAISSANTSNASTPAMEYASMSKDSTPAMGHADASKAFTSVIRPASASKSSSLAVQPTSAGPSYQHFPQAQASQAQAPQRPRFNNKRPPFCCASSRALDIDALYTCSSSTCIQIQAVLQLQRELKLFDHPIPIATTTIGKARYMIQVTKYIPSAANQIALLSTSRGRGAGGSSTSGGRGGSAWETDTSGGVNGRFFIAAKEWEVMEPDESIWEELDAVEMASWELMEESRMEFICAEHQEEKWVCVYWMAKF